MSKTIKEHVKDIQNDIDTLKSNYTALKKDVDTNVSLTISSKNRIDTMIDAKSNVDKLKENQVALSTNHNISISNIKSKLETIDRDYAILAAKLDALSKTLADDIIAIKQKLDDKFVQERHYNTEQYNSLLEKITTMINDLDVRLSTKIDNVASETVL